MSIASTSAKPTAPFANAQAVASYADRTRRLVPGSDDLQKMAGVLLAERAPPLAKVLVVGAGGGAELGVFAQAQPQWRFVGVDPSEPMLQLAQNTLGPLAERVDFHHGYVHTAPAGPFDAASCLLTLHFLPPDERLATLQAIRQRLQPGAPLVAAHLSFPLASQAERSQWLSRYTAFAIASGVDPEAARRAATAIDTALPLLSPDEEEALLEQAGFSGVRLFYAGLAFRGWVAYA
ncbi:class I SAM-dependent methyltransferase [Acidovorax sp. LjRoot118]|uniref:class I SAM-dependent methyltransferase n=1 Tax=Acidovorax sp. LjRoot118 TaxID=3342256 RepID=UPI003ECD1046